MRIYKLKVKKSMKKCEKILETRDSETKYFIETYICFLDTIVNETEVIKFLFPLTIDDVRDTLLRRLDVKRNN